MKFCPDNQHVSITHKDMELELKEELSDIQGIVSRGYDKLNSALYLLLQIDNVQDAKGYFQTLRTQITSADRKTFKETIKGDPAEAVQIAFTVSGLRKLLVPEEVLQTFSREFYEGMPPFIDPDDSSRLIEHRSLILGDTGPNDPKHWLWGNIDNPVDCIIMLFAKCDDSLKDLKQRCYDSIRSGVTEKYNGETYQYKPPVSKEQFGFDDGIAQPLIKGFSKAANITDDKKLLNTGEFILGYLNEYYSYAPSPKVPVNNSEKIGNLNFVKDSPHFKDLGKNGTYMVHRQMYQNVEAFWKYAVTHSCEEGKTLEDKAVALASKMVGRKPDGFPLFENNLSKEERNNFDYTNDSDGAICPFGSHMRRSNPRNQIRHINDEKLSLEMVRKHSMLRRARIFGQPLDENFDIKNMIKASADADITPVDYDENSYRAKADRGLHFFCLVSDISRQFEFVQSVWSNTSTFAYLCNEVDPITSPRPTEGQPDCVDFTVPGCPVRKRYTNVPQFTNVIGGAYYFLPSLKALDYIIG